MAYMPQQPPNKEAQPSAAAPLHHRYSTFLPNLSPPPPCLPTEMTIWGQNLFNIDGIHTIVVSKQGSWAKVPSASSSGSQDFIVREGWLIVYKLSILSLSCSQYSQTICWGGWDDNACLEDSIGAWPNCAVSPLLQINKQASLVKKTAKT